MSQNDNQKPVTHDPSPARAWTDADELQRALAQAKATNRLAGLETSPFEDELIMKRACGEITHEEFTRLVLAHAKSLSDEEG